MSDATTILDDVLIDNLGDDGYEDVDVDVTLMTHQNEEDEEGEEEEEEEVEEEEEFADEDDAQVEDDVELEGDEDDEDDDEYLIYMSEKSHAKKKFRFTFSSPQGTIQPTIDPIQNPIPTTSPPFHNHTWPNTQLSTIQPMHLSFGHVPPTTTTPTDIPTPITTPETSQPSQEVSQPIEDVQRQTKMKIFPRGKE
ncbi:hypothetical protein Cgig2_020965 [Carnegiea gigantea]|uniref:Uncharacterized protein n=1 Tax=Carnegiea gigantea TaxID=171969 RepID=A0A9Q1JHG3_9CARY|nr:hypothetical protein Cgig2_020965 [Carnegiea gigantea]